MNSAPLVDPYADSQNSHPDDEETAELSVTLRLEPICEVYTIWLWRLPRWNVDEVIEALSQVLGMDPDELDQWVERTPVPISLTTSRIKMRRCVTAVATYGGALLVTHEHTGD